MSELRKRMIKCLQLRGVAERTQEAYIRAVRQLAAHYHKSPDQISEAEHTDSMCLTPNARFSGRARQRRMSPMSPLRTRSAATTS